MLSEMKSRQAGKKLIQILFFFFLVSQICFAQWYQQVSGVSETLRGVYFTGANNGIVVGGTGGSYGIVLRTINDGSDWIIQTYTVPCFTSVSFSNENFGIAVGDMGKIFRTTDGGINWEEQTSGVGWFLYGIDFSDLINGIAVGNNGTILKTTDGGINWEVQYSGTTAWLTAVSFNKLNNCVVVGDYGKILRSTDGGITWSPQASGTTYTLSDVHFSDENNGTAVGGEGTILRTTDGGVTWTHQTSGTTSWLYGVHFTDGNNGTAVGHLGTILRTINGGESWTQQTTPNSDHLLGVFFTDTINGTAIGANGTILHTTNGGVSFIEEEQIDEVPTEFLLSQNYPNPFNPTTTIEFRIANFGFVNLKIYDVLGNEVATLVDEYKPAGHYEVEFNSSSGIRDLASGIYFYQLLVSDLQSKDGRAENYIETKKMILIK